jgi:hypothetical protein
MRCQILYGLGKYTVLTKSSCELLEYPLRRVVVGHSRLERIIELAVASDANPIGIIGPGTHYVVKATEAAMPEPASPIA